MARSRTERVNPDQPANAQTAPLAIPTGMLRSGMFVSALSPESWVGIFAKNGEILVGGSSDEGPLKESLQRFRTAWSAASGSG